MKNEPLNIRPLMSDRVRRFTGDQKLACALIDGFGSPLNIIFPQATKENLSSFESIYRELDIDGKIFGTHKPNKSAALVHQLAFTNSDIDVSSAQELKHALGAGFHPDRIEATGPKNDEYLQLCLLQGVLINIDNGDELRRLITLSEKLPMRAIRIMLRLHLDPDKKNRVTRNETTFGFNTADALQALDMINGKDIHFVGFSFHLGSAGQQMWPDMFAHAWDMTQKAFDKGHTPEAINIGGGYPIRLAQCEVEWNAYIEALKSSVLGEGKPLSWNDNGLGFSVEGGKLKGHARFPNHAPSITGAQALKNLLTQKIPMLDHHTPLQLLQETGTALYIEPGRALYDQAGITLARVLETRISANGEQLVRLEMNRTNINAVEMPLMTDPVIIHRHASRQKAPEGVFYVGNLCRHHDMIQYHRTFPEYLPEKGDIVAFINTAPYMMDFAESDLLHHPVAQKIAVTETAQGFSWQRDHLYNPLESTP